MRWDVRRLQCYDEEAQSYMEKAEASVKESDLIIAEYLNAHEADFKSYWDKMCSDLEEAIYKEAAVDRKKPLASGLNSINI